VPDVSIYIKKLIICWNGEQEMQEGDVSIGHLLIFMFKRSDKGKGFKYNERREENVECSNIGHTVVLETLLDSCVDSGGEDGCDLLVGLSVGHAVSLLGWLVG